MGVLRGLDNWNLLGYLRWLGYFESLAARDLGQTLPESKMADFSELTDEELISSVKKALKNNKSAL